MQNKILMITLGIHDGHTATACLMCDGRILACISEERLNRIKEYGGFPEKAIQKCMEMARIKANQIDGIGIVGLMEPTLPNSYNAPHISKRIFAAATSFIPESFFQSDMWVAPAQKIIGSLRNRAKFKSCFSKLGMNSEPTFYEHHYLHAVTAHYLSWFGIDDNLIITCDGSGDAVCATVNIAKGNEIKRVQEISNYNSIGEFYTQITQFLGMKPMSHEYKVMGLAPYAKEEHAQKTLRIFESFFDVNGSSPMSFKNTSGCWKWRYIDRFQNILRGHRFDNIARAAQMLVENILVEWISNCVRHTGIKKVVLSGGVFMNVKANNAILDIPEIEQLFILPSCGDESLAIGAAIIKSVELGCTKIDPIGPLYFGPEYSEEEIQEALNKNARDLTYTKIEHIEECIAKELSEGKAVARFANKMEWGARSLGNRSILADARNRDIILKINEAIKNRDFWMPFAPSIMDECEKDYIQNPKDYYSPYMIMAFPTKEKAKTDLIAGLHPYDFTARPQIVRRDWNPSYYELLKTFKRITGVGGILNTSFNLHGEAIACSPEDAIYTFTHSALDGLAIGNFYVKKKN
ncbi:MAG: hypothetical protein A2Y62_02900 [Candidatus Fischerbacteria bacterium RBG_13_37_8]|uniref:Carbamoyltransferase n=1 Tax=Candidatus Fischerbacteria bacterium RBG_13_37_8 TaxID=1817863 RepID=A0A1F5VY39_9BACT|nr:MAG: hypothetical protein A2Y62_02900 [Candidatus Fischerbacteria bacterium RBG_13_37_8]